MRVYRGKLPFAGRSLCLLVVIFSAAASHHALTQDEPRIRVENGDLIIEDKAFFLSSAKWQHNSIYVCWENHAELDPSDITLAQNAVKRTWEEHSALNFNFTGDCLENSAGLRVLVEDDSNNTPHVKALGQQLDGIKEGIVLNFTFNNWRPRCKYERTSCIESVTIHEFGHAIGFSHEQNRPDTKGECALMNDGPDGDTYLLTPWDPNSVMNYCNKKFNNGGNLSQTDILALKIAYPLEGSNRK